MLELPEALVLAGQIKTSLSGKQIARVTADQSPHKFAWYCGDPQGYSELLTGLVIRDAAAWGGMVEILAGSVSLVFGDGVCLRFHAPGEPRPAKHQLLLEFADGSGLSAAVQMYGGLWCFPAGSFDNPYYRGAQEKPSPLTEAFDPWYFAGLLAVPGAEKLSVKAFLATEQRIPGLGNGVLQDILYLAGIHPKKKIGALTDQEKDTLYTAIKSTLAAMADQGGRDTERDLFGQPGGYVTRMSKNTAGKACPRCGSTVVKESYMGGSVYYCGGCQPLA